MSFEISRRMDRDKKTHMKFKIGNYVRRKSGPDGRIGRIRSIACGKVVIEWGKDDDSSFLEQAFNELFVLSPKPVAGMRLSDYSVHLVFKWSYNDANFKGICTWDTIERNSSNSGIWCSQSGCWRLQKKLSQRPRYTEPTNGWPCDEARLFSEYEFNTGGDWRKDKADWERKDLVIDKNKQKFLRKNGRIAFMTTRPPGSSEADRLVFGFQEIGDIYTEKGEDGAETTCIHGIPATSLLFPTNFNIRFWKFYSNKKPGEKWGQGLFRYLSGQQATGYLQEALQFYKKAKNIPGRDSAISIINAHLNRLTGKC